MDAAHRFWTRESRPLCNSAGNPKLYPGAQASVESRIRRPDPNGRSLPLLQAATYFALSALAAAAAIFS